MSVPIIPITPAQPAAHIQAPLLAGERSGEEGILFHSMFQKAVNTVENFRADADRSVETFLSGENTDVHAPIIATQKADLTFELFMQVRNKVISAYQEVMRMQV